MAHRKFEDSVASVLEQVAQHLPPKVICSFGRVDMDSLSIRHLELGQADENSISGGAILALVHYDDEKFEKASRIAYLNFTLHLATGHFRVRCRQISTD